jgi:hypothetical protein
MPGQPKAHSISQKKTLSASDHISDQFHRSSSGQIQPKTSEDRIQITESELKLNNNN